MSNSAHWSGVVMDSTDPQRLARFWADALGYVVVDDSPGWVELQHPNGAVPHLTCQGINQHVQHGATTSQGNRVHFDLGLPSGQASTAEHVKAEMTRLEQLGARRIERVDAAGQPTHWIWADPEGNVFCAPGL